MSIKYKIALSFSLLLTLVLAAFWLTLKLQLEQTLARQTDSIGQILAKQTADSITELVLASDLLGLNVVLNQLAGENGVASVTITDVDGIVMAATGDGENAEQAAPYIAPISVQGAIAGNVSLYLDAGLQKNPVARPNLLFYLIIVVGMVLVTATSWALATHITQPLVELLDKTSDPDPADEPIVINITRQDEIGLVQQRFADLYYRQRELEQQIEVTRLPDPSQDEKSILKPERRMATLLLVQVANCNTAIELLHPATLATLLQQYQFYLRQAARLYRGKINGVNGDSMLVSFDTRHCQEEHAFNALCCAQLFLRLMKNVSTHLQARNTQALDFKLSVHSGPLYFSPVWIKNKTENDKPRPESVIGKPIEMVHALLGSGRPSTIVVSELSYDLAEGATRFITDNSSQITVGTDKLTLMTYSLTADSGLQGDLLERQCQHLLPEA